MGLSAWLRKRAAIVPLIVTVPGGTGARLAVERVVRENGWRAAQNPAAANLVIVAGTAAADFEAYLLRLMATVPEPHARVDIAEGDDVEAKLTAAVRRMRSTDSGQANADAELHVSSHHGHGGAGGGASPAHGDHESARHPAGHEDSDEAGGHYYGTSSASGHDGDSGHHEHMAHEHGMPPDVPGLGDETHSQHTEQHHHTAPSSMDAEAEAPRDDSAAASSDDDWVNPGGNPHDNRSHDRDMGQAGEGRVHGHSGADHGPRPAAHGDAGHEDPDASGAPHHNAHGPDHADRMSHGGESASHMGMEHGGSDNEHCDGHEHHGGHDHHSAHGDNGGHGGHGGHGHHGHDMGMELPGGLVMADRAPDRDGLMLDVLTLPLGPVSVFWPAGLALTTTMQGDVIDEVVVSLLDPPAHADPFWVRPWLRASAGEPVTVGDGERYSAARRLDAAAALLAVAGWDDKATVACRLRDELLIEDAPEDFPARLNRWARQVTVSSMLRWSLRRVGHIAEGPEVPTEIAGDAHSRLLRWIHDIVDADSDGETALKPGEYVAERVACARWIVDSLPDLLRGAELAEARLIVASLAPDVELLAWSSNSTGAVHG
ncbi:MULTISPECIES: hypothetical protein [Nocardia]|nr:MULTISPECIES: hypothetical protein [Nocardia]